jgi:hypothetical protein
VSKQPDWVSTLIYIGAASVGNYSPHNDVVLNTVKESPVLQREGFTQNEFERSGNPVPTVEGESGTLTYYLALSFLQRPCFGLAWTFAKQKWQRTKGAFHEDEEFRTAQILPGFREQIYA